MLRSLTLSLMLALPLGGAFAQDVEVSVDSVADDIAAAHVDRPDAGLLRRAALEGLVHLLELQGGADGVRLLSSDDHRRLEARARGERHGVGIGILVVPGYGIRILEVFDGTPAQAAGLRPGDVVVAVDGVSIQSKQPAEILALLNADARSLLTLDLLDGDSVPRRVKLVPTRYDAPPVSVNLGNGHRLVRVHHFGAGAAQLIQRQLEEIEPDEALVIDLRDAGDGLLHEAAAAAAPFLGGQVLIGYQDTAAVRGQAVPIPAAPAWHGAFAVLVNGGTRGIAELFVAAIQRVNQNMSLVGSPTAGVASLPTWVPVGRKHMLQLPGARLTLADGTTWSRVGVVPDVVVEPFMGAQLMPPPAPPPDLQIDAALQLVRAP